MKSKRKTMRLEARRRAYDALKSKDGTKRPGSLKK